ncbi:HET domain protein [Stagonosporopsis vannaccii]|nr:HET domain protein [Stagonosporopsis vannaccii]
MKDVIASSRWGRRGWTYQEGLLSRRRLVFTDTQVYFQCLEQHFCESLSVPMGSISRSYQREAEILMQHTQAFPPQGVGTLPKHIYERLREYHLRQLSHDSDILYAFTGILHHFVRRKKPTYHIWGLPFIRTISENGKDLVQDHFLLALLWLPGYDWKGTKLTRRVDFPSWSWVGWRGIVGIQAGHDVANTFSVVKNVDVSIATEGVELLSVAQYVAHIQAEDYSTHRYNTGLHMTGWIIYVRVIQYLQLSRSNSDLSDRGSKATVDISDESGLHKLDQAYIMTHYVNGQPIPDPEDLYHRRWPVLLYFSHSGVMHGIILREMGETEMVYEKLGVLPYLKVDPQPESFPQDSSHRYLLKRDYGPSCKPVKLYCERKSIILR